MGYFYYQLNFQSPVHFGQSETGGKLEKAGFEFSADSLFSAICAELAQQGELDILEKIVDMAKKGELLLSDLFPFMEKDGDEIYYLPRPYLFRSNGSVEKLDMEQAKVISAQRKAAKKQQYIRASEYGVYIKAMAKGEIYSLQTPLQDFGENSLMERVNCRQSEPLPYYVGQYTFAKNAGLYGIVKMPEDFQDRFISILYSLGLAGIGGERSSGYGCFTSELFDLDDIVEDTKALMDMLENSSTTTQMNISVLKPAADELENVKEGQYQLKKRSGFTDNTKRDSVYMLASGSCFKKRLNGEVVDISRDYGHPIWRYGKGLFVGLEI